MIATVVGRLQTKALTYPLLALITLVFVLLGGPLYLWAMAVTIIVGLILETFWGLIVEYEPGWLTILFGVIEFMCVLTILVMAHIPMPIMTGVTYYGTSWTIIQLFLIYLLPIWYMGWNEYGGELWN